MLKKEYLNHVIGIMLLLSAACGRSGHDVPVNDIASIYLDSKPYTRYWWFASVIKQEDVKYNLDWLKAHGFGGVELAWVYPLNRFDPSDTTYTPRQEWLSPEWQEIVEYTIRYADSIGLGCDLTLGTLWPFGDSRVPFEQAAQRFGDPEWRQVITRSWEHPEPGYVIDHLTPSNYMPYLQRMAASFPRPLTRITQSYFIDSWEVETERLWCDGFEDDFISTFGYDITPYMDSIYVPSYNKYLYDYMSLISEKVLGFYRHFDSVLNSVGVLSRGQVSGAPCDLISGYALMDIPEGESMLFEPEFCAIPASAALLSGRKYVSSETFTCLYGWPADYIREEQTADLKLVADALFANGVNHITWHGKAHNPKDQDTVSFYASTHIGDKGNLEPELTSFNKYLETVSDYMRKGTTYSDIAVYLPTEDAWCAGVMPGEDQFIWAWGHYEMRYVYFPEELKGYNPVWINGEFLDKAVVENGLLKAGDGLFKALYVDSHYIDYKVLKRLMSLAGDGLKVILRQMPGEPGTILHTDYSEIAEGLKDLENVSSGMPDNLGPFIRGTDLVPHWCRKDGDILYVFFSNPGSERIRFPLEYGQSLNSDTIRMKCVINWNANEIEMNLVFDPYQSLLYKIENGEAEKIDIEFIPKKPVVKKRPAGYEAPWLVN